MMISGNSEKLIGIGFTVHWFFNSLSARGMSYNIIGTKVCCIHEVAAMFNVSMQISLVASDRCLFCYSQCLCFGFSSSFPTRILNHF